jgi:3-oxoadipate enol-lactonase
MPKAHVNGINLYYEVHGKGEPLLLIQGFGGGHQAWFFQVQDFKKRFRVITFDNRGMGKSDRVTGKYDIGTLAADIIGLMDYLGIGKAHILGLSLGGMVAQEIATTYPDRVKKLILASTFPAHEIESSDAERGADSRIKDKIAGNSPTEMNTGALMGPFISASFNKASYRRAFSFLVKIRSGSNNINSYLQQIDAVKGYSALEKLHMIRARTLVITGKGDRLVRHTNSDILAAGIPGARLCKIEGGSHALFMEMKDRFNAEVLHFLAEN